jgi:hypothetical protein
MNARRLILAILCVCLGALAASGAPAQAAFRHEFLSQITEVPASSGATVTGPLAFPESMAVDSSDNLYVADPSVVDKFNSSGVFLSQFGDGGGINRSVAVNDATGEVYVASTLGEATAVEVFSSAGILLATWRGEDTPQGSLGSYLVYVAVDNSTSPSDPAAGDVYVSNFHGEVVNVFKPEMGGKEKYVTQIPLHQADSGGGTVAVEVNEANGDLVVASFVVGDRTQISIWAPTGVGGYEEVHTISGPPGAEFHNFHFESFPSVAAERSSGDIYVTDPYSKAVDQFSATGEYIEDITGTPNGAFGGLGGVAVGENGDLYIADLSAKAVDVFGPNLVVPDAELTPVSNLKGRSVTLNGTVNPDAEGEATCSFEYGTSTAYGQTAACSESVPGSADSPVPVSANVSGLQPDTTYHYRLEATNRNGTHTGLDKVFKTSGQEFYNESTTDIASSSATFDAQINPNGAETHVYFEYGTSTAYGSEDPAQPGALFTGIGEQSVAIHIQGLQPGATYHYRIVASSEYYTVEGPDQTFTTQAVGGVSVLPDGRAWEMVSPPEKDGGLVEPIGEANLIEAAADGGALAYVTSAPTEAEPAGYANFVQVLATRGVGGWSSQDMATRHENATGPSNGRGFEYRDFSPDLSQALVEPQGPFTALSSQATEQTPYLRTNSDCGSATGCYTPLVTATNDLAGTKFGSAVKFVGATPNLTDVVLQSTAPLTSTPGDEGGLYEWGSGRLQLVSVLPTDEGGSPEPRPRGGALGLHFGSLGSERNAISADGSRIVWFDNENDHLYMRDTVTGETARLDGSGPGEGNNETLFQAASTDGSRVFFTDLDGLTADSHSGPDLYMCQMAQVSGKLTCDLTDLTPAGVSGGPANVIHHIAGASEDGSYVYFVAKPAGSPNLYVAHDDNGEWTTTLIATLSTEDAPDWAEYGDLDGLTDRVSPDGHYFAFMSSRSLTGYDTRDAVSGQLDEEVYLYDAVSNKLVCASCDPTGARPRGIQYGNGQKLTGGDEIPLVGGDAVWREENWLAANIPGWTSYTPAIALYQSRYLSDSGRLFFDSSDALVPQDVNGTEDVYEYEPPGIGDCSTSSADFGVRSGGCVGLISSGGGSEESGFVDASENGSEVFFVTSSKLLTQDFDNAVDVYDARECTVQSPCTPLAPVAPPVCTTGDACKASPSPQPAIYGAPSSETFSGAGNLTPIAPTVVKSRAKSLTRAQKLTKALKVCARMKSRKKRATCEKQAKRAYGATNRAKKTNRRGN